MEFMTHVVLDYSIDCIYMCMYIYVYVYVHILIEKRKNFQGN